MITASVTLTHLPYLAEAAAAQADRELPAWAHPRKVTSQHVLEELKFAANLFQRAQRAVDAELIALEAAGMPLDASARLAVTMGLSRLAANAQLVALGVAC